MANRICVLAGVLLATVTDPNSKTAEGDTPLHLAAGGNHEAAAKALIAHGADRAAKNAQGQTALDIAQQKQYGALVAILSAN